MHTINDHHLRCQPPTPDDSAAEKQQHVQMAIEQLLEALGLDGEQHLRHTPKRAADLWLEHLLAGQNIDIAQTLARRMPATSQKPVLLHSIGIHMVCPHHLTVAMGMAHLGYIPTTHWAGLGALSDVIKACTAQCVLQEEATTAIAHAIGMHLNSHAVVVCLEASHPCHSIHHPRSHQARTVTWAEVGEPQSAAKLRDLLYRERQLANQPSSSLADDAAHTQPHPDGLLNDD